MEDFGGDVVSGDRSDSSAGAFEGLDVVTDGGLDWVVWGEWAAGGGEVEPENVADGAGDEEGESDRYDVSLVLDSRLLGGFAFGASEVGG